MLSHGRGEDNKAGAANPVGLAYTIGADADADTDANVDAATAEC